MKSTLKTLAKAATAVSAAGALLVGGVGVAFAATPPYEPDATGQQLGQLVFYDAAGNQVTSGSTSGNPFAKFAVATTNQTVLADNAATLYGYLPKSGVDPLNWAGEQLSGSTAYPVASPAYIAGAGAKPVVTNAAGDTTLAQLKIDIPNTATDGYAGLYQLRLTTPGSQTASKYWATDIQITGTTWQVVYPSTVATTTTLAATGNPQTVNPAGSAPAPTTLTATVTGGQPGTVQFSRNGAALGSPVTVAGGIATKTDTPAGPTAIGGPVTTNYTSTFTPAVGSPSTGSNSNTVSYVVQNKAGDTTSTGVAVTQTGYIGEAYSLTATVANTAATPNNGVPVGSVDFFDNASATALNPSPIPVNPAGQAVYSNPAGFPAAGSHSIVGKFTPTNATLFAASQGTAPTFSQTAKTPTCVTPRPTNLGPGKDTCTDDQTFDVVVAQGTLTISTPYTPANPFHLGTMGLNPAGNCLEATQPFGTSSNPATGVTITDTRAGINNVTASVVATDFASSAGTTPINAQNLGFINVTPVQVTGNGFSAATVVPTQNPNGGCTGIKPSGATGNGGLGGAPHQFAFAPAGPGSVYVIGTMDLVAPTSTIAGTYTSTVTFTIV